jgi:hypothetical protein
MPSFPKTFRAAILAVALAGGITAQTSTSQISGTVTDSSGSLVPGAVVTLLNEATGVSQKQVTTDAGFYAFPAIPVGTYTVRAEAPGFRTVENRGNTVQVNTPLAVNLQMEVGGTTETVQVSAAAESVQATNAVLGNVVEQKAIVTLPLNGRNPLNLLIYEPGVTQRSGSGVSVNGSRGSAVNVTIDGIEANESSNPNPVNNIFRLNPDNVQEFKVTTSNPTPEEGRNSGANVSIATRSGTNELHGTLFEFFRNTNLNAKEFFANAQDAPKPEIRLNQYGFEVGGPIRKNRTFAFGSWQGQKVNIRNVISSANLYTPAALNGDFRYFVVDPRTPFVLNGQTITQNSPLLIDQNTGALAPGVRNCGAAGDTNCVATYNIFANDPARRGFDPMVKSILGGYPAPNTYTSSTSDGLNLGNYTWGTPYQIRGPQFLIRIDHTISDRHSLWGRWLKAKNDTLGGDPANSREQLLPGYPPRGEVNRPADNVAIGLRSVLSPRVVNELTLGYSRFIFYFSQGEANPNFPNYRIASFNNSSTDYTINPHSARALSVPQIINNLSVIEGAHVFRFGGNIRMYQHNDQRGDVGAAANSLVPQISLSRTTRPPAGIVLPGVAGTATPGIAANDLARLQGAVNDLLGIPASLTQIFLGDLRSDTFLPFRSGEGVTLWSQGQRLKQYNLFAQDEWKVKQNLTLSYGIRWEINPPATEVGGRVYRADKAIDGSEGPVSFKQAGRWYDNWSLGALAPRLSVAWAPGAGKVVIRTGYGLAFDPLASFQVTSIASSVPGQSFRCVSQIASNGSITTTPGCTPVADVRVGAGFLQEMAPPTVKPSSFLTPPAQLQGVAPPVRVFDPNLKLPTTHMWNFTLQRQVAGFVVSAGYVGRRGTRLWRTWDMNQIDAAPILDSFRAMQTNLNLGNGCRADGTLATGAACAGAVAVPLVQQGIATQAFVISSNTATELRQNAAGSFAGRLEQTTLNARLRRNQQFSQILYLDNGADSNYHSLQLSFRRRFDAQGLLLNGAYTLGKAIDNLSSDPVGASVDGGQTATAARTPADGRANNNERGRADFDQRHVFNMSGIYELPVGKGKAFGSSLPKVVDVVLGGWSLNGIFTYQSGEPFSIKSGVLTHNSASQSRVALAPGVTSLPQATMLEKSGVVGPVLFPDNSAFALPGPGEVGIGRNIFQNPSYWNMDLSVVKGFQLTERLRLTFRTELFNALNHPNFRAATQTYTSTTFGTTCCSTMSTASSASTLSGESWRVVQFAMKLAF